MNVINKIKIEIAGMSYVINSPEEPEYVKNLTKSIDTNITELMEKNSNVSINDALVLTLLGYADTYKKSEKNADHMRSQLTDYLEDAARSRIEADEARREIQSLKREIQQLKKGNNK